MEKELVATLLVLILIGFCMSISFADTYMFTDQESPIDTSLRNGEENIAPLDAKAPIHYSIINCLGATVGGILTAILSPVVTSRIQSLVQEKRNSREVIKQTIQDYYDILKKHNIDIISETQTFLNKITKDPQYADERKVWDKRIMRRHKLAKLAEEIQASMDRLTNCRGNLNDKEMVVHEIRQTIEKYLNIL